MDWRLELIQVPVSDVDRAKAFYTEKVGFHADHDERVGDAIRFVQLTPSGSACSIALGTGLSDMPPGSVRGLQLVVPDIHAALGDLRARGVRIEEYTEPDPVTTDGIADMGHSWAAWFIDPSGNVVSVIEPKA